MFYSLFVRLILAKVAGNVKEFVAYFLCGRLFFSSWPPADVKDNGTDSSSVGSLWERRDLFTMQRGCKSSVWAASSSGKTVLFLLKTDISEMHDSMGCKGRPWDPRRYSYPCFRAGQSIRSLAKRPPSVTVLLIRFRLIFTPQSRRIHLFDGTVIVHDSHVSYTGMNKYVIHQTGCDSG